MQRAEEATDLPRASLVCKVRVGPITEEDKGSPNGTKCEATCEVIATLKGEAGKEVRIRYRRDGNGPRMPGLDAVEAGGVYIVMLEGDTATLAVENLKLAEPQAKSMEKDVRRWAAGAIGCKEADREWAPEGPDPDPETWKSHTKKKGQST